jgi:hypothetical protein
VQNLNVLQVFRAETWGRLQKGYERNAITATFFGEGCIFQPYFSLDALKSSRILPTFTKACEQPVDF